VHGSCKPLAVAAQTLSGLLVSANINAVPSRATSWTAPCPPSLLTTTYERVADTTGVTPTWGIVQLPRDKRRRRFNVLLLDRRRRPFAFVKFSTNEPNLRAIEVHKAFSARPPKTFWAPGYLVDGAEGDWSYLAVSSMPNLPHGPARLSRASRGAIISELQSLKTGGGPRVVPVHGDFGPWNVRRLLNRRVAVFDWEEMTEGPVVADELWHSLTWWSYRLSPGAASHRVLDDLSSSPNSDILEGAEFWLKALNRPEPMEIDSSETMPLNLASYSNRLKDTLELLAASNSLV
jgi:hypothetical protein